ncbi:tetratricopeptide repeat protein [Polynucleobacter wuianus]|uniref:O-linked N-acetylglucosamine transferase, SPINDLY family protein n=1 Tax=Polynucleobacter wuianus TaxID=1743168 RepID=UPI001C0CE4FB|nr:glycosyltransferase family 41 protein [Polynucleobacter wuianus]MBU3609328.1 tetratricopeptide repeat protein [Polynucleobacter wuianus]
MAQPYAPLLQQMLLEFQNQRLDSAERLARSILRVNSKDLVALQVQGLCMAMQGRVAESIKPFALAATLDSKNTEILTNLAKAQHQTEFYAEAIASFEKLNKLIPNNVQVLTDLGTSYAKNRHYKKAELAFDRAIQLDPSYFLAWSNKGNLFADQGYPDSAINCFEKALQLNPTYAETWTNYGNAFFDLGRFDEACKAHDQSLLCNPDYAEAWFNKGNCLIELKQGELALESYSKAFELKQKIPFLIGQLINSLATQCNWESIEVLLPIALKAVSENKPAVPPFILLQTSANLALQYQAAQIYLRERIPFINDATFDRVKKSGNQKIRIGYFSSDFKEHPVGILIENLIKLHDRSRFEIYGFFLSKKSGDFLESRLVGSFDKTFDLFGIHDIEAQKQVVDQGLDIAVDLNGHTAGARTGLFARKIAPLQLSYLGYAGTSGASFYDYLIADQIVIPEWNQKFFSEKLAYMPNSFFPADTLLSPQEFGPIPTRVDQGLPADGFIFASFNNSYKITQQIFTIWMNLLKKVSGSVLWLSKPSDLAIQNLREYAQKLGVDPNRLVFAKLVPARIDHLSRLRLADLFLDTPHFNAHTTAADTLWAGVPVLTQIGETFAGRVAASQLTALGMGELITKTPEEYFAKALELANDPQALIELRNKQEANRFTTPLFNTKQYVKDLESLYSDLIEKKS